MDNNVNAINSNEKNEHKWWILERIRNSSRKVIAPVIAAWSISLWWLPAATIPVTWATAVSLLTACSSDEPDNPLDTTAPTVNVNQHDVDITWWKQVRISWNQLYIWDMLVASRTDNVTKNCKVELSLNWKTITSWTTITEEWYLTVKVTDDAGNTRTVDIKLNVTQNAPSITVNKYEVNVFWWVTVNVSNNQLLFWDEVIATWTDEDLAGCKYTLSFNWHEIKAWDVINESWKLTLSVTNKLWKSSVVEITLTNDAIYWLENLRQVQLKVDNEINLLSWLTFAEWAELVKVEIEMDGKRSTIADPSHYIPEYPWVCNIIFTVKWRNGNTAECRVDNLTINALEYQSMEINDIRPVDILPIIGQVEVWDKRVYEHIEHLRLAEATRIRDMMWKYGAGNHSAAEYQQLMNRLNTGMRWEIPLWYNNYEVIWDIEGTPSDHARAERSILNSILKNTNFKIVSRDYNTSRQKKLMDYIQENPNSINIFWSSIYHDGFDKSEYDNWIYSQSIIDLCNENNIIIFAAGTNIETHGWTLRNKIYNWDYTADENWCYSLASMSNSKKNSRPNSHLFVTIATDNDGNIDQTGITYESTKYPVWFANNVLFSGRWFPQLREWKIYWPQWKYTTSDTNYLNVALCSLLFQLHADATDVNQLLEMIKSTVLKDHITLNWETQELQLMNPAWFFKEYCMPNELPTQIRSIPDLLQ